MTLTKVVCLVYGLFGILYVLIGVGSMLLPTGWLPQILQGDLAREASSPFVEHLLQEFGTVSSSHSAWYFSGTRAARSRIPAFTGQ